jgi:hypothetical protein
MDVQALLFALDDVGDPSLSAVGRPLGFSTTVDCVRRTTVGSAVGSLIAQPPAFSSQCNHPDFFFADPPGIYQTKTKNQLTKITITIMQ